MSNFKVARMFQTVTNVGMDGTADTANANSKVNHTTKPKTDTPRFGKSTKASRARSQVSKNGTISRKNTDNDEPVVTTMQCARSSTDNSELVAAPVRSARSTSRPTRPKVSEICIVLEYDELFPHCKVHGAFVDMVDANNKVIELFKADELGRQERGKVQPYISEHGCLQYYRDGTTPKRMAWALKVPVRPRGTRDALLPWPNEEEMTSMWEVAGPARRRAAGW
ncbi:hypothetical protein IFR05_014431 [Cadophora sp. M221]|nr:hypothetical protein IFR05_014431 [Cadophora sp. M221]